MCFKIKLEWCINISVGIHLFRIFSFTGKYQDMSSICVIVKLVCTIMTSTRSCFKTDFFYIVCKLLHGPNTTSLRKKTPMKYIQVECLNCTYLNISKWKVTGKCVSGTGYGLCELRWWTLLLVCLSKWKWMKQLISQRSLLLEVVFEYTSRELKIIAFNHVDMNYFPPYHFNKK